IMLSSLTQRGADAAMKALYLGAVDFISKPSGAMEINNTANEIIRKIKIAAATRHRLKKQVVQPIAQRIKPIKTTVNAKDALGNLVLIGTSTGGPRALHEVIPKLPGELEAADLVVQHMPSGFTRSLAERLDRLSALRVKEAKNGEPILRGCVYIAPGDFHLKVKRLGDLSNPRLRVNLTQDPLVSGHRPSVDAMIDSVVKEFWSKIVTVIMTGMGQDGAKGTDWVKNKGGKVIAEDSSTCIVYGMPRAVIETGNADRVLPLQNIANAITKMVL
ncbi:MAG: chemotaxis-specific protein-glutamate methyltransferase CheB, partial [Syntrophomonadaceae bacterium]|nr:chemotaxis-specific protein-glutamate methyltransferase CheB [Syntrophomonadaceae bacterium]